MSIQERMQALLGEGEDKDFVLVQTQWRKEPVKMSKNAFEIETALSQLKAVEPKISAEIARLKKAGGPSSGMDAGRYERLLKFLSGILVEPTPPKLA